MLYDKGMNEEKYNGWVNRATWDMALWIDNEYASYKEYSDYAASDEYDTDSLALQMKADFAYTGSEYGDYSIEDIEDALMSADVWIVADWLKEQIEENNPLMGEASHLSDAMTYGIAWLDYKTYAQRLQNGESIVIDYDAILRDQFANVQWNEIAKSYIEEYAPKFCVSVGIEGGYLPDSIDHFQTYEEALGYALDLWELYYSEDATLEDECFSDDYLLLVINEGTVLNTLITVYTFG